MQDNQDCFRVPIGERCVLEKGDSGAEIFLEEGKSFSITVPESYILKKLLKEQGSVVDKKGLICEAWGNPDIIGPNSLPVAITNLRKILDLVDIKIINVPRIGYRIELPDIRAKAEQKESEAGKDKSSQLQEHKEWIPLSTSQICLILLFGCISLYGFLYIGFSWVRVNCTVVDMAEVCFVDGDDFDPNVVEGKAGRFYYSSKGGLLEVRP